MPYIPGGHKPTKWNRRAHRLFYSFNFVALIPVAALLLGFVLDKLSRAGYVDLGNGLIGFALAAPVVLLGFLTLMSVPVNLAVTIAAHKRDHAVSVHAFVMLMVVIGALIAMNATYLLSLLR